MPASLSLPRTEGSVWWRRVTLLFRRRLMPALEIGTLAVAVAIATGSYFIVTGGGTPTRLLTPPLVALLLVANLVPVMALLVLLARRVAKGRAARSPVGGNGRLHVRLVALFSVIASVPTLLVVIFASLLFQYGVEFWFSDRARTVLENADSVAQAYVEENKQRIVADIVAMGGDVNGYAAEFGVDSPRFAEGLAWQVSARNLSEAAVVTIGADGTRRLIAGANLDNRPLELRLPAASIAELRQGRARVVTDAGDRVETVVRLDPEEEVYLYASRGVDPMVLQSVARAKSARGDYASLLARSRSLQLQFNAALLVVSLLIVATAILIALKVADRLVRPVSDLVGAARQVAAGNLSARVKLPRSHDEIGTLAAAFNRMTRKLEEQTGALVTANQQLENRRALTEAVLSGVSAGVISVDEDGIIRLINTSAAELLKTSEQSPVGQSIADVAPELGELISGSDREAVIQFASGGDPRTLAVTLVRTGNGQVLTFDDITQQLLDQRRAAWSDVARRIAHEIKNPLTPIQLAAERLQRRYGQEVQSDKAVFERLTGTIVRQVGDLRRMVDEFSSFARMPKPIFRAESVVDIARQALFLHEVAHPAVRFALEAPDPSPIMVCDRRQLGQALTNIVKNAVEAIEARGEGSGGTVAMVVLAEGDRLGISVSDDGIGLPPERERITEPYMTTRARGTGLGLAIVRKIVEEHFGTIVFSDRNGGGTTVTLTFDVATLRPLDLANDPEPADGDAAALPALTRQKSDG
ncbi:two-component system, NtrC family, nitrogen regulation sensor histidine kinase NtrY [Sphingomonas laterariae]|uniref:histidine kinase n=1 Tax=Edaphosphingomonas laterariae TaxID=861865 RepID=A0A239BEG8_9SPHN|nr:PAS domain-containing sensor histidine kinase [Sphingomonas laterariae]SNS06425.1 two-component system, NtrC family, nitrogen regulation sensor histidine kinase NtrY [Sphingomonas laterariae]